MPNIENRLSAIAECNSFKTDSGKNEVGREFTTKKAVAAKAILQYAINPTHVINYYY